MYISYISIRYLHLYETSTTLISQNGVTKTLDKHITSSPRSTAFFSAFASIPADVVGDEGERERLREGAEAAIRDVVQPGMARIKEYLEEEYLRNTRYKCTW